MSAEAPPSRRGRILIALLVLLLILLPLYLWPLRGGPGGPRGATALPGPPPDPRSAAALAQIPGEVWDVLMGATHAPAPGAPPPRPRNLTMIGPIEDVAAGALDAWGQASPLSDGPAALARTMIAQLPGRSDLSEGDGSTAMPGQSLVGSSGAGAAAGGPWNGIGPGGSPGNLGPWQGGGPGDGPRFPVSTFSPEDPGALEPTPEPATLLLVGSNLALLGAAAWRRHHRGSEGPSRR